MSSRVGVSLCGAVALIVLTRAAAYYARTDALALALVLVMTAALVGAIVELLARVGRASRLTTELAALPRPATLADIENAREPLRSLLRGRLGNTAAAAAAAPLAGYVVGLLVMLGLLGTFLGLFETLRGAREALTTSGDVNALRASLAAPMQGLTRSFGTSAAGVSASAMLGLAAALARRAESRFAQALAAYAASGLAPLTSQARQLAALEQVAAQGEALPRIVSALEQAVARLSALEGTWSAAHADAAKRTSEAVGAAVERAGSDVQRAVGRAVESAQEALTPLVARAVEGSVAAAKQHVVELGARLDADLEARRVDDAARGRAFEEASARIAAAEEQRATLLASRWADAAKAVEAAAAAGEARGENRDAAFARVAAEIASAAKGAIASAGERLDQAEARGVAQASQIARMVDVIAADRAALAEQAARTGALLDAAGKGSALLMAEVQRGVEEHAARARALEEDVGAALAAAAGRLAESLERHAADRDERLAAATASVREAAGGMEAASAELSGVAEMFASAVDRHREGAGEWLAALGTVEGAIARAANEAAGRALDEQLDRARELFDAQLQFHRELLRQLRGNHLATDARRDKQDEDVPG